MKQTEILNLSEEQKELWDVLQYTIDEEGFHYCFNEYSEWKEIEDMEFHKKRLEYLEKAKELNDYIEKVMTIILDR